MKKLNGRQLSIEISVAIVKLPDEELFGAAEVARRIGVFEDKKRYKQVKDNVWKLGNRNSLSSNPDNCERDEHGRPLKNVEGKVILQKSERFPRFLGRTWKEALFEEDRKAALAWIADQEPAPSASKAASAVEVEKPNEARPTLDPSYFRNTIREVVQELAAKQAPKKSTTLLRLRKIALVCFCALLFTATVTVTRVGPNRVLEVYRTQGPQAALKLCTSSKKSGLDIYFTSGWMHFMAFQYEEASRIMNGLLEEPNLPEPFLGRVYYVMGAIAVQTGNYEEASQHLNLAKDHYARAGNRNGVARTQIEQAHLLRKMGEAQEALTLARSIEHQIGLTPDLQNLYMVVLFSLENYELALEYALSLYDYDDINTQANALVFIAACHLYLDNPKMAWENMMMADALIADTGNINLLRYNQLNKILLSKCKSMDVTDLMERLARWARETGDYDMIQHLAKLDRFDCGAVF